MMENMQENVSTGNGNESDRLYAGAESQESNNKGNVEGYRTQIEITLDTIKNVLKQDGADSALVESETVPNASILADDDKNLGIINDVNAVVKNKEKIYSEIIKLISDENIEILNSGDNSLIVNLKIEETKEILNDYVESIVLTEENDNTKILIK